MKPWTAWWTRLTIKCDSQLNAHVFSAKLIRKQIKRLKLLHLNELTNDSGAFSMAERHDPESYNFVQLNKQVIMWHLNVNYMVRQFVHFICEQFEMALNVSPAMSVCVCLCECVEPAKLVNYCAKISLRIAFRAVDWPAPPRPPLQIEESRALFRLLARHLPMAAMIMRTHIEFI